MGSARTLSRRGGERRSTANPHARTWLIGIAAALFFAPDLILFARTYWLSDRGLHGVIILGLGLWLLLHEVKEHPHTGGDARISLPLIAASLVVHTLVSVIGSHWLIWMTAWSTLVIVVYDAIGWHALRRLWFPLLFVSLAIPPSGRVLAEVTLFLTNWLAWASVETLWLCGWDVARDASTIYLGPYELRVIDACAGLNSMISLFAVGTFYLYIRRESPPWRLVALAALVFPIVMVTGLCRTLALLLITDAFGDAVAQGILHEVTGVAMFGLAFALLMTADRLLPGAQIAEDER